MQGVRVAQRATTHAASPCIDNERSPYLAFHPKDDGSKVYQYQRGPGHSDCTLPGKSRGMCSLGQVRPFPTGNVFEEGVVRSALQARAFKNEIIVLYSSSGDDAVAIILHFVFRLRELGLDHWLVLMDTAAGCARLLGLLPDAGCVYLTMSDFQKEWEGSMGGWFQRTVAAHATSEFVQPWWEDMKRWTGHSRWPLLTRIAQHGVNMLMSDGDVYFAADPYAALKHPALSAHNMVIQAENFHSPGANTGGLYIQDYDPRGVVPWILSQVPYRSLRWVEGRFRNPLARCAKVDIFEQGIFNDALCSATSGELIFMWSLVFASTLYGCTGPQGAQGLAVLRQSYRKCSRLVENRPRPRPWKFASVKGSALADISGLVGVPAEFKLMSAPLSAPRLPAWPPHLPFYPPSEGPATRWWRAWLNSEGLAMLDERSDAASGPTNETVAFAPRWLMSRWHELPRYRSGGSHGWWNPAVQPPRAFIQHMVMLTWPAYPVRKLAMHFFGWWRYEVDKLVSEPSYMRFCRSFRFLALAPGLAMRVSLRTMSPTWRSIMFLALLTNRHMVWPLQSCSARIVDHSADCFNRTCNMRLFSRGAGDALQCQPATIGYGKGPSWQACSDYGLNAPQLDHFLTYADTASHPSAANTAWFAEYQRSLRDSAPNTSERDRVHAAPSVDAFVEEVERVNRGLPAAGVLWLGRPVALADAAVPGLSRQQKQLWDKAGAQMRCAYDVKLPERPRKAALWRRSSG